EIRAKAVASNRFNAAKFAVGVGIVDRPIEEVADTGEHTTGAGETSIAITISLMEGVSMRANARPHIVLSPVVDGQPVIDKAILRWSGAVCTRGENRFPSAACTFLSAQTHRADDPPRRERLANPA